MTGDLNSRVIGWLNHFRSMCLFPRTGVWLRCIARKIRALGDIGFMMIRRRL